MKNSTKRIRYNGKCLTKFDIAYLIDRFDVHAHAVILLDEYSYAALVQKLFDVCDCETCGAIDWRDHLDEQQDEQQDEQSETTTTTAKHLTLKEFATLCAGYRDSALIVWASKRWTYVATVVDKRAPFGGLIALLYDQRGRKYVAVDLAKHRRANDTILIGGRDF